MMQSVQPTKADVEAAATGMRVVNLDDDKKMDKQTRRCVIGGCTLALVLLTAGVVSVCYVALRGGGSTTGVAITNIKDSLPTDSTSVSASDGCAYQGKIFKFGASWRCCDGCNICSCEADGSVRATEKACDPAKYANTCKTTWSPSPSPALSPPPPSAAPSPPPSPSPPAASDGEMEAPDPAILKARDAWLAAMTGGDSEAEASSLHVGVTSHPSVVPASDETMAKIEKALEAKLAAQDKQPGEEEEEEEEGAEGVMAAERLGFTILEQVEGGGNGEEDASLNVAGAFKETTVDLEEDPALLSTLGAILPSTEGHTGGPKAPDVGDASPGDELLDEDDEDGRRQLKVMGADDRRQASCHSAHTFQPFYQVVAFHSKGSNWAYCSGTLVAPDVVLTAGHCVYDKDDGGWQWPDRVSVRSCNSADAWRTYKPKQMMTWTAWTRSEDLNYDIALVKLHSAPDYSKPSIWRAFYPHKHAGDLFGWKSFGWHNGMTDAWNFVIAGYPGDKQRAHGYATMWWDYEPRLCKSSDAASCANNPKKDFIRYRIDTAGGQSGSGVFKWGNTLGGTHQRIYAVHAYGFWHSNGGPRITRPKFLQMCAFISNGRVC